MSRSMSTTLRGKSALDALAAYFAPASGGWGEPEELRGRSRDDYANHQAVSTFLRELFEKRSRHVYLEDGERIPLGRARFRPYQGDPDVNGDEGTVGFHPYTISLDGIRIRISAPGVIEMADRWGDAAGFGTSADAAFDQANWETDEWDLPAPVMPLAIKSIQEEALKRYASSLASRLFDPGPTNRHCAELAIVNHYRAVFSSADVPQICWFNGPEAAIAALSPDGRGGLGNRKTLRDRALMKFDMESTVQLLGKKDELRNVVNRIITDEIYFDFDGALLELVISGKRQDSLSIMGLAADYSLLAWYETLHLRGVKLPKVVLSFMQMTNETWLMFPMRHAIHAVERPVSIKTTKEGNRLVGFSNGESLELNRRI